MYQVFLALAIAAMVFCVSACQSSEGTGQSAPAPAESAGTGSGEEKVPEADGADEGAKGPEADGQTGGPKEPEPDGPAMGIGQYRDMAEKFAFYCDSVYFDYQGRAGNRYDP